MLKKFLLCMVLAFFVFIVFQMVELIAHIDLLQECIAETVTTKNLTTLVCEIMEQQQKAKS